MCTRGRINCCQVDARIVPVSSRGRSDAHAVPCRDRRRHSISRRSAFKHRLGCADASAASARPELPTRQVGTTRRFGLSGAERSESRLRSRRMFWRDVLRSRQQLGDRDDHVHATTPATASSARARASSTTTPARRSPARALRPGSRRERLVQPPRRGQLHGDRQPLRCRGLLGGDVLRPRRRHRRPFPATAPTSPATRRAAARRSSTIDRTLASAARRTAARTRTAGTTPVDVSFGGCGQCVRASRAARAAGRIRGPTAWARRPARAATTPATPARGLSQIPYDATAPTVKDLVTATTGRCERAGSTTRSA